LLYRKHGFTPWWTGILNRAADEMGSCEGDEVDFSELENFGIVARPLDFNRSQLTISPPCLCVSVAKGFLETRLQIGGLGKHVDQLNHDVNWPGTRECLEWKSRSPFSN
jgi:hypothetical protein